MYLELMAFIGDLKGEGQFFLMIQHTCQLWRGYIYIVYGLNALDYFAELQDL